MRHKSLTPHSIGARLRLARESSRLTLRECAERTGIKPATLAAIESGKTSSPSIDHLIALGGFLEISVDDLLNNTGWFCFPEALHQAAVIAELPYSRVAQINLATLRGRVRSAEGWIAVSQIAAEHPESFEILRTHPETLDTIMRQVGLIPAGQS